MSIITEVCADNLNSAITADRAGADRIELCQGLSEGGAYTIASFNQMVQFKFETGSNGTDKTTGGRFSV